MAKDTSHRFMLENADTRGEWVHLDNTWQEVLKRSEYPEAVRNVLGEAMAAAVLLSATVKHKGSLILQIRGDGPVHLLVVQATPEGNLRGLARWQSEPESDSLAALFGQAQMAITLEATTVGQERYQGIVALEGQHLSEALEQYFLRSEQLPTRLWLCSNQDSCAGILLQRLPGSAADTDDWQRAGMLLNTLTTKELIDNPPETTLLRLFHEESPRLFEARPLRFHCDCSLTKIETTLKTLGEAEARAILEEQGRIKVQCDFCNSAYILDRVDVARLFSGADFPPASQTLH